MKLLCSPLFSRILAFTTVINRSESPKVVCSRFMSFYDTFPKHCFRNSKLPENGTKCEVSIYRLLSGRGTIPLKKVRQHFNPHALRPATLTDMAEFIASPEGQAEYTLPIFVPGTRLYLSSGIVSVPYVQNQGSMHPELLGLKGKLHFVGLKYGLKEDNCIAMVKLE